MRPDLLFLLFLPVLSMGTPAQVRSLDDGH
jgi:hypothetical protein